MIKTGISIIKITPPLGVELSGYGPYLRRTAKDVHDDLYAKAIFFDDNKTKVLWIICDLVGLNRGIVVDCKKELSAKIEGLKEENIIISATHTHSGPATIYLRGWGKIDKGYIKELIRKIIEVGIESSKKTKPVTIGFGKGKLKINYNRVVDNGKVDDEIMVMKVEDKKGEPAAVFYNYNCHAVVLRERNFSISADYPGYASKKIETETGNKSIAIFLQGFCGDIDPIYLRPTFDSAKLYGDRTADEVLKVIANTKTKNINKISVKSKIINLPLVIPTESEVDDEIKYFSARDCKTKEWKRFFGDWKKDILNELSKNPRNTLSTEIQLLKLGEYASFVILPCELFTEFGMRIKKISGLKNIFVVCYSNDYIGYIPDKKDFEKKNYASSMVPYMAGFFKFRNDVGDVLVKEVKDMILKQ
ncbi:MAG: neutral/alkaline non-lysosomal ceramidase N-terminal domain-containing protein [Elusimicrobia bacterium]|nr:neutral/alkaline non-lysosomal ceramidase N-terminal domain-containing protein [Elusimicrobiota bacterium]